MISIFENSNLFLNYFLKLGIVTVIPFSILPYFAVHIFSYLFSQPLMSAATSYLRSVCLGFLTGKMGITIVPFSQNCYKD